MWRLNKKRIGTDMERLRAASAHAARKLPHHRLFPRSVKHVLLGVGVVIVFILGCLVAWASVVSIPSINNFENRKIAESTKIYDRTGNVVLYDVHGSVRRTAVPLADMSPLIQHATVSIEDAEFYTHHGFRPLAFLRALFANISSGSYQQGGSTITQQVVKNALLTTNKTIFRKIEEIILALRLEQIYSKDQILETYLNETNYGGTIYGVEEASQYFFGVEAKDVDVAQAAYLAAIPQAPTHLSPYGTHKDELNSRKNLVLQKMKENNYIDQNQYDDAIKEKVEFLSESEVGIKAPHFVFYIRDYLEQKYGADVVESGGLRVITTLDYDLQKRAEDTVRKYALSNAKTFNASNAALVAVEPKTGQILTMVGSRGYFDTAIDGQVNVALAHRQPGSSFKPFVYATAFEKGYTPDTVVFDLQTQFSTACSPQDVASDTPPCYSPSNYDGSYKGPMTLRNALAQSENIPAVKVLYLAGVQDSIATARALGITTLADAAQYGLTLVLGGGEVTLLDMTGAYSVFANDGVRNPPTGILRVEDKDGNVLESYEDKSAQVIDPQIARTMNDVLSDNVARTPEFGADSPLNFSGYDVADKTGTTNDFRDLWVVGYTPGIAAGAWAGNNDNTPAVKKIAAFIVAPMWHEFMTYALAKYPSDSFVPPSPNTDQDTLPAVLQGNWNTNPSLGVHDILYWVNKDNPRLPGGNSFQDVQFTRWEYPVQLWVQGGGAFIPGGMGSTTVTPGVSPVPGSSYTQFAITSPTTGTFTAYGASIQAMVAYDSTLQIQRVTYYLNGSVAGMSTTPPFSYTIVAQSHGPSILRAVAETSQGPLESSVSFTMQ